MNFKQYLRENENKSILDKMQLIIFHLEKAVEKLKDTESNVSSPVKGAVNYAMSQLKDIEKLLDKKPTTLKVDNKDPLDVLKEDELEESVMVSTGDVIKQLGKLPSDTPVMVWDGISHHSPKNVKAVVMPTSKGNAVRLSTSNISEEEQLEESIHSMFKENDIEITEGIGQMILDKLKSLKGKKPETTDDNKTSKQSNDEIVSNAIKAIKDAAKSNNDKLLSDKISDFIMILKFQIQGPAYI